MRCIVDISLMKVLNCPLQDTHRVTLLEIIQLLLYYHHSEIHGYTHHNIDSFISSSNAKWYCCTLALHHCILINIHILHNKRHYPFVIFHSMSDHLFSDSYYLRTSRRLLLQTISCQNAIIAVFIKCISRPNTTSSIFTQVCMNPHTHTPFLTISPSTFPILF